MRVRISLAAPFIGEIIMYYCPVCQRGFQTEDIIRKHFLSCWKEHNPNYQSTSAPRSADIINRKVDNNVLEFFKRLK